MRKFLMKTELICFVLDRKVLKAWPRIKEDLEENAELVSGNLTNLKLFVISLQSLEQHSNPPHHYPLTM